MADIPPFDTLEGAFAIFSDIVKGEDNDIARMIFMSGAAASIAIGIERAHAELQSEFKSDLYKTTEN